MRPARCATGRELRQPGGRRLLLRLAKARCATSPSTAAYRARPPRYSCLIRAPRPPSDRRYRPDGRSVRLSAPAGPRPQSERQSPEQRLSGLRPGKGCGAHPRFVPAARGRAFRHRGWRFRGATADRASGREPHVRQSHLRIERHCLCRPPQCQSETGPSSSPRSEGVRLREGDARRITTDSKDFPGQAGAKLTAPRKRGIS